MSYKFNFYSFYFILMQKMFFIINFCIELNIQVSFCLFIFLNFLSHTSLIWNIENYNFTEFFLKYQTKVIHKIIEFLINFL